MQVRIGMNVFLIVKNDDLFYNIYKWSNNVKFNSINDLYNRYMILYHKNNAVKYRDSEHLLSIYLKQIVC